MLLAVFSVLSTLLGILRDRLLAQYVGVGPVLDVYNAAFRIPDFTLGILVSFAGALTVVPFITKAIHENDKKDLEERFSSLFIFFGSAMLILAVLVVILIPYFSRFIVPGFTDGQIVSFIFYTRILMIQPILLGLSTLISALAQARHQFILYGSAPLIYTLGIIISIVVGYKAYGLIAIIIGVIIGACGHILLQSITLYHHGVKISLSRFRWRLIKEQLSISIPRSMSQMVTQLRMVFFTGFATTLGPGALSIYIFAQKIIDAVIQVISQSIATANLPVLSSHYALGDMEAYKSTFKKNIIAVVSITTLLAIVCGILSNFIVYILYGDVQNAKEIATLLTIFSIGLPLYSINTYFVAAFNAVKDNKTLFLANASSVVIAVIICFVLRDKGFGLLSIGFGSLSVSFSYSLFILYFYLRKKQTLM